MHETRLLFAAGLLSMTVSCDPWDAPNLPTTPSVPAVPPTAASLKLTAKGTEFFVGEKTALFVRATDASGRYVHADSATISSSDPSVISLSSRSVITFRASDGSEARGLSQTITVVGPGTSIVRASLNAVSDSLVLTVMPLPPVSMGLVIDSFTVIEYRDRCAWDCPYLVYAPLLKLREPTGTSPVDLLAMQFDVSPKSTGLCTVGPLRLGAGFAGHINQMNDYLWFNAMILVQLDGAPLPAGSATVRVIFRDSRGVPGMAEAQAEIQRMVSNPAFPLTALGDLNWSCPFHFEATP